jgi:hypothetical protein
MDTFNLPYYNPYEGEVREIIEMEGSFDINKLETFAINWDANDYDYQKKTGMLMMISTTKILCLTRTNVDEMWQIL